MQFAPLAHTLQRKKMIHLNQQVKMTLRPLVLCYTVKVWGAQVYVLKYIKKNFSFSGVFLTLIYYFFSNEEVTYFELSSVSKKRQATEIHERYDEYSTNIR